MIHTFVQAGKFLQQISGPSDTHKTFPQSHPETGTENCFHNLEHSNLGGTIQKLCTAGFITIWSGQYDVWREHATRSLQSAQGVHYTECTHPQKNKKKSWKWKSQKCTSTQPHEWKFLKRMFLLSTADDVFAPRLISFLHREPDETGRIPWWPEPKHGFVRLTKLKAKGVGTKHEYQFKSFGKAKVFKQQTLAFVPPPSNHPQAHSLHTVSCRDLNPLVACSPFTRKLHPELLLFNQHTDKNWWFSQTANGAFQMVLALPKRRTDWSLNCFAVCFNDLPKLQFLPQNECERSVAAMAKLRANRSGKFPWLTSSLLTSAWTSERFHSFTTTTPVVSTKHNRFETPKNSRVWWNALVPTKDEQQNLQRLAWNHSFRGKTQLNFLVYVHLPCIPYDNTIIVFTGLTILIRILHLINNLENKERWTSNDYHGNSNSCRNRTEIVHITHTTLQKNGNHNVMMTACDDYYFSAKQDVRIETE